MRDVYVRAKELLLEKGWCQGSRALDAEGESVRAVDSRAASFCLIGAIARARYDVAYESGVNAVGSWWLTAEPIESYVSTLGSWSIGSSGLAQFNDKPGRTKEEVIAVLDAVIAGLPERLQISGRC